MPVKVNPLDAVEPVNYLLLTDFPNVAVIRPTPTAVCRRADAVVKGMVNAE